MLCTGSGVAPVIVEVLALVAPRVLAGAFALAAPTAGEHVGFKISLKHVGFKIPKG